MKILPPQVVRPLLVAVCITGVYVVAKTILAPSSFGVYGFYRGDSLSERANLPIAYAGGAACAQCHTKPSQDLLSSPHKTVACETCHGPSAAHVRDSKNVSLTPAKIRDEQFCLRCHLKNISRPKKFPQVKEPDHSGGEACASCHLPHQPQEAPE